MANKKRTYKTLFCTEWALLSYKVLLKINQKTNNKKRPGQIILNMSNNHLKNTINIFIKFWIKINSIKYKHLKWNIKQWEHKGLFNRIKTIINLEEKHLDSHFTPMPARWG